MSQNVYEIYFIYKGMPYRRVRSSEQAVDKEIKALTLKGARIQKIVKW